MSWPERLNAQLEADVRESTPQLGGPDESIQDQAAEASQAEGGETAQKQAVDIQATSKGKYSPKRDMHKAWLPVDNFKLLKNSVLRGASLA